jgi:hypothetical protein
MPRRPPKTDPELQAHKEWLGYLQPRGLVVAPTAMGVRRAGCWSQAAGSCLSWAKPSNPTALVRGVGVDAKPQLLTQPLFEILSPPIPPPNTSAPSSKPSASTINSFAPS